MSALDFVNMLANIEREIIKEECPWIRFVVDPWRDRVVKPLVLIGAVSIIIGFIVRSKRIEKNRRNIDI